MKPHTTYMTMTVPARMDFVNITDRVTHAVAESGVREGLCLVKHNGDAHHKRQVMGREVVVAVTKGALDFGPWEQIFYGEFDGRRPKRILIKVIGE